MNIFAVSSCPRKSAEMLCDKHVVKMPLESAQMLCTVHREWGDDNDALYKSTHPKHPSTRWAGLCKQNYMWLFEHFVALNDEYKYRYNKGNHLSFTKLIDYLWRPPIGLTDGRFTLPTPAMPDECKVEIATGYDVVASYRKYYNTHKQHIAVWTRRSAPDWFIK